MKSVKFSKEDQAVIIKSLEEQDFETFISYFRNTDLLVECEYMLLRSKQKLAPTESAEFQVGRRLYYVKITEMIKIQILNEWAGFIKGQIYWKIKDLEECINDYPKLKECTSKDLFLTEQTQWFLSTTFSQKIQVNSIEYYSEDSTELQNHQYYTRADYNTLKQQFRPPISQWSTYCFCKRLYDPSEPYIQCDQCSEWVHYVCSGKSEKELKNISKLKFICLPCGEAKKKNKQHTQDSQNQDGESTKVRSLSITQGKKKK